MDLTNIITQLNLSANARVDIMSHHHHTFIYIYVAKYIAALRSRCGHNVLSAHIIVCLVRHVALAVLRARAGRPRGVIMMMLMMIMMMLYTYMRVDVEKTAHWCNVCCELCSSRYWYDVDRTRRQWPVALCTSHAWFAGHSQVRRRIVWLLYISSAFRPLVSAHESVSVDMQANVICG